MSKKTLELIDVLREELNAAGMCFGVDRVRDLTESVLRRVVSRTGGQTVYIRTNISSRSERMQSVLSDFDGKNAHEVARKHHMSVRSVYRLLEKKRLKKD
ncbi:Mor transcription activator family protein [Delftia sp. WSY_7]|uniref:Mor transcription activator family protein n=1 Tax=Delftia sp. WSY_7 TaxID=3367202 RepID=UPI003709C99D